MADAELGTSQQPEKSLPDLHQRFQTAQEAARESIKYRETVDTLIRGDRDPWSWMVNQTHLIKFNEATKAVMARQGISQEDAQILVRHQAFMNELGLKIASLSVESMYLPAQIDFIESKHPDILPLTNQQIVDLPDPKANPPQPLNTYTLDVLKAYAKRKNLRLNDVLTKLYAMQEDARSSRSHYASAASSLSTYDHALFKGDTIYSHDQDRAIANRKFTAEYEARQEEVSLYGSALSRVYEIPTELQGLQNRLQAAQITLQTLEGRITQDTQPTG